jgi:hypothetical protein
MRYLSGLILSLSIILVPTEAPAQDPLGSFTMLVENDIFAGSDRHYTHGTRFMYLSRQDNVPDFAHWFARNLPLINPAGRKRIGWSVGQNIYTPDDIGTAALVPDDRPYAGWIYGTMGLVSETRKRLDSVELSLGLIGPASQASGVQEWGHDTFGFREPKGWDNQLNNEPTLNLTMERAWRNQWPFSVAGLGVDITPHVGAALGNVLIHGAGGATLRFGTDLANDFGPPRIRPSLPGSAHFTPRGRTSWYVFAGAEARAVGRNIFLDGNTFTDSHSVDKKHLVGEAQVGFAILFPRFRITYTHVIRTKEFRGQAEGDRFGAISITARF